MVKREVALSLWLAFGLGNGNFVLSVKDRSQGNCFPVPEVKGDREKENE